MFEELVKRLRDSEHEIDCSLCDRDCCYPDGKVHGKCIIIEASDAIEELSVVVRAQKAVLDKFPRWIPVTERLPEQEKQVLVTGIEAIGNVQIYGVKQLDGDVWRPTSAPSCYWEHWMPLPEPPKEE